jgi:hypothetical protein
VRDPDGCPKLVSEHMQDFADINRHANARCAGEGRVPGFAPTTTPARVRSSKAETKVEPITASMTWHEA